MNPDQDTVGALCRGLGLSGSPTFFVGGDDLTELGYEAREALTVLGMDGVLCLGDGFPNGRLKPVIYIAGAATEADFSRMRREVWTQGVVPFVLIVMGDEVFVCNAFASPDSETTGIPVPREDEPLPLELSNFHVDRIASSLAWSKFVLARSEGVDGHLIRGIELLNEVALHRFPELKRDRDLINSLIGRFIYLYVLIDRGILTQDWLAITIAVQDDRQRTFISALFDPDPFRSDAWGTKEAFAVFDALDRELNGAVFEIAQERRGLVPDELVVLIHDVLRKGTVLTPLEKGGAQLSFLGVSYRVLRTETISAMYERFVTIQDSSSKTADGIFYTPPHLADHVLDRVEGVAIFDQNSRILDCAAGSGIFLVGAYRRLMNRHAPPSGWTISDLQHAVQLLTSCIHGFEKHWEAAAVARFSLQLTMLDYVGKGTIEELVAANGRRFLPHLHDNVRVVDAFDPSAAPQRADYEKGYQGQELYTHVIGNPPWSTTNGQRDRSNRMSLPAVAKNHATAFAGELRRIGIPVRHSRLADMFVWLAHLRLVKKDGVIGFVLPTRSLIGRTADGFTSQITDRLSVKWVANLSHLRRKLFEGVEAPASVVVAINRKPISTDRTAIYRPLLPSLPGGANNEVWRLLASPSDIRFRRPDRLDAGSNGWLASTMLSDLDARMREAMATYAESEARTFDHFLKRSGLVISKGGSASESGVYRADSPDMPQSTVYLLTPERFALVLPDYRGFFAGNLLLVPRSLGKSTYYDDPVAYSSSYNAIIPAAQYQAGRDSSGPLATVPMAGEVVSSMVRYLNSGVLKYFAALFGATYLIDGMRVEKNDLLSMPCPFHDTADPAFLRLGEASDVDDGVLSALNAGAELRAAFREHHEVRSGFVNSKVPARSLLQPTDADKDRYLKALRPELQAAFGLPVALRISPGREGYEAVSVGLGGDVGLVHRPVHGQYLGASSIMVERSSGTAEILKAPILYAWTIDQAVTDAIALTRAMRG